eukprot:646547-Prorocentrum_minimum.AAC.1
MAGDLANVTQQRDELMAELAELESKLAAAEESKAVELASKAGQVEASKQVCTALSAQMEAQEAQSVQLLQAMTAEVEQAKQRASELAARVEELQSQVAADAASAEVLAADLASVSQQRDELVSEMAELESKLATAEDCCVSNALELASKAGEVSAAKQASMELTAQMEVQQAQADKSLQLVRLALAGQSQEVEDLKLQASAERDSL